MGDCAREHHAHGHGDGNGHGHAHGHGDGDGHGHSHGADAHESWERGAEFSLYQHIDTTKARALNCTSDEVTCFKPWEDRLREDVYMESDADDEMILVVPFTGTVTLKAIRVVGGRDGSYPRKMKVWANRDDIDFDNVHQSSPTQEWDLLEDFTATADYQTRIAKFQGVTCLTFLFTGTTGAETLRVSYVGLRGQFAPAIRNAVITVYEASANPADHKTRADAVVARSIQ